MYKRNWSTTQSRIYILTSLVFIIVTGICGVFIYSMELKRKSELYKVVLELGNSLGRSLEQQLDHSLSTTLALASILHQYGSINNFDALAEDMIDRYGGISSLQLAPDGIVNNIYPLKGNKKAIGHDLLNDPVRREKALATIQSKRLTLAGPLDLIQGGKAVIGRYPVFLRDKKSDSEHFWGFTIVLIKLSKLLEAVNFEQLTSSGYDYKLSRIDPNSNKQIIFAESNTGILRRPVSIEINVPNGSWVLNIAPRGKWYAPLYFIVEAIFAVLVGATISLLANKITKATNKLRSANKMLTKEITGHKQASQKLQKTNEQLQIGIAQMPSGYILWDKEFHVLEWNHAAEKIFGYSKSEILGKFVADLIVPEDARQQVEEVIENLQEGNVTSYSKKDNNIRKDGKLITCQWYNTPLKDRSGNTFSILSIVEDITERLEMEKELIDVQKLESVGILAGGIAHDFNNCLQSILGYIALAKMQSKPDSEIHEYLEEAEKAVHQSTSLTQQLLTFSKGGAPVKRTISVSELVMNSTKLALSGSNVRCKLAIPDGLWLIDADKGQINQVISNLTINADQAMPEGGSIRVRAENINVVENDPLPLKEGRYVKISIGDNGKGISQNNLHKIFDPYFTTKKSGSGLGLATTYSIIQKHDGYITVESEIGVGSTFHIYLPASQTKITTQSVLKKTEEALLEPVQEEDEEKPVINKGRILLMDDEYSIRTILCEQLRCLKYEVEAVEEGSEVIRLYKSASESGDPYDAVIMDLTISGGMGGQETIKRLLEIDSEVKAIVISGYANDPIMANHKKYGFRGVLAKPHGIYELDVALQKVIVSENHESNIPSQGLRY